MDMDVVARDRVTHVVRQQAFVHIGLGRLRGEYHHHARRRVGVHVRVLAGDLVGLGVDDLLEDFISSFLIAYKLVPKVLMLDS